MGDVLMAATVASGQGVVKCQTKSVDNDFTCGQSFAPRPVTRYTSGMAVDPVLASLAWTGQALALALVVARYGPSSAGRARAGGCSSASWLEATWPGLSALVGTAATVTRRAPRTARRWSQWSRAAMSRSAYRAGRWRWSASGRRTKGASASAPA